MCIKYSGFGKSPDNIRQMSEFFVSKLAVYDQALLMISCKKHFRSI